jgi:hypothetical protein
VDIFLTLHAASEMADRRLEDLDYLFSNESHFVWNAERDSAEMKSHKPAVNINVKNDILHSEV